MTKRDWDKRYREKDLPWDTGRPDKHLQGVMEEYGIQPCPALEIGCGTGTNSIWLAKHGFEVTGIDVSSTAIAQAGKKAKHAEVKVHLFQKDALKDGLPSGPFGFVFDRGCFHSFDMPLERTKLAELISRSMTDGGLWFSIIGSADGPKREVGPPQRSALDIVSAVEPCFEILLLRATLMDSNFPNPPTAWECLMQKRK